MQMGAKCRHVATVSNLPRKKKKNPSAERLREAHQVANTANRHGKSPARAGGVVKGSDCNVKRWQIIQEAGYWMSPYEDDSTC